MWGEWAYVYICVLIYVCVTTFINGLSHTLTQTNTQIYMCM